MLSISFNKQETEKALTFFCVPPHYALGLKSDKDAMIINKGFAKQCVILRICITGGVHSDFWCVNVVKG